MKIIFSMPASFIRTKARTNPFFDPIIEVCRANGLDWNVLVPCKRRQIGYAAEHVIDGRAFDFFGVWFWRLVHLLFRKASPVRVYALFGKIWRWISFGRYHADLIISVAGQFVEQLEGVNPSSRFADLQHGVIYSKHDGYFNADGSLRQDYRVRPNREFWLYGPGYADSFFKNPENHKWLDGRVKVIGDVVRVGVGGPGTFVLISRNRNLVVLASQITPDESTEISYRIKQIYERFLETLCGDAESGRIRVVLRHHPRFADCIDMSDWKVRYPWLGTDARPLADVFSEALCCVTINSTTVFDAIPYGCPSVLLDGQDVGWTSLMTDEYGYPASNLSVSRLLEMPVEDYEALCKRLMTWYNSFYTPFSEEWALDLLLGRA